MLISTNFVQNKTSTNSKHLNLGANMKSILKTLLVSILSFTTAPLIAIEDDNFDNNTVIGLRAKRCPPPLGGQSQLSNCSENNAALNSQSKCETVELRFNRHESQPYSRLEELGLIWKTEQRAKAACNGTCYISSSFAGSCNTSDGMGGIQCFVTAVACSTN